MKFMMDRVELLARLGAAAALPVFDAVRAVHLFAWSEREYVALTARACAFASTP